MQQKILGFLPVIRGLITNVISFAFLSFEHYLCTAQRKMLLIYFTMTEFGVICQRSATSAVFWHCPSKRVPKEVKCGERTSAIFCMLERVQHT